MPRIFDNIEQALLPALQQTLEMAERTDFCIGYFNMRGWKQLDRFVERWPGGEGNCCRLLFGMQRLPVDELRAALSVAHRSEQIDNQTAMRMKKRLAEEFREQLTVGTPINQEEACLRRLAAQIKAKKVVVKLFPRHPRHAKLYLLFRPDPVNPIISYLGSSNLTLAGLSGQGELNVDVLDHDACVKLAKWFEDRWNDRWCIDISDELIKIIDESWAREALIPPYHIYVKMAYHLSQEARAGLTEFNIPSEFRRKLFEFQSAAVRIAARHINKRGGVLIGDVVGLGKTLMATTLARIFEDDFGLETLILCPKNLVPMWEDYRERYRLRGRVLSINRATKELPKLRRYRLVLIDESQNLRNREGKRYRAIHEYLGENDSKCILLSATPYNKTYLDLASQLRLFVPEDQDLGIRPERLVRELGETEFIRRHQCPVRSLAAFEKSEYADDWRELMRLYLVRRTRTFIKDNYAEDEDGHGDNSDRTAGNALRTDADFRTRAAEIYAAYSSQWKRRFKWLRPGLFVEQLAADLRDDIASLLKVLKLCGEWDASKVAKLGALVKLLTNKYPDDKVLIFTQFADTVYYLERELRNRGVTCIAGVTGQSENPTAFAWRFNPVSNDRRGQVISGVALWPSTCSTMTGEGGKDLRGSYQF